MDEHTDYMVEIRQPVVQSTILMQPGLLAATSCPFSVRRWRQREGERKRGRQGTDTEGATEKGSVGRRELEEESKERTRGERTEGRLGVQAVWRLHRHTLPISRGEREGFLFGGSTGGERGRQE